MCVRVCVCAKLCVCTQGFAYRALLRLEEDRIADEVPADETVQALVAWAQDQQADEDHRLYP